MSTPVLNFRPDKPANVETRLLAAGKKLFAQQGFERTTTAAIAREAGTSESQLLKYFGNKEGLLEAIFVAGWERVSFVFSAAAVAAAPPEALRMLFELLVRGFQEDKQLRDLMLLEGRRIRSGQEILLTGGYLRLVDEVTKLVAKLTEGSEIAAEVRPRAIASSLLAMLEGMLRDQVVAERKGKPEEGPTPDEMRSMFRMFVRTLVTSGKATQS